MKRVAAVLMAGLQCLLFAGSSVSQQKMKEATVWPSADIKWVEMKAGPAAPRRMVATLWGEVAKGPFGALVKLPAGVSNPLHIHTATIKFIILSGSFWYQPEGGEKKILDAGSYLLVPGGLKHYSGTGDQGCTLLQEGDGAFDLKPVELDKK